MHNRTTENSEPKEIDGLAKLRAYRLANQDEEELIVKRWRVAGKMLLVLALCAVIVYGVKFLQMTWQYFNEQKLLHETTAQITQLVGNIRQFYVLHDEENKISEADLIAAGAVPITMLKHGKIINSYGGSIAIASSLPIKSEDNVLDTFKISLQGLPYKSCVTLAQAHWGSITQGVYALAVGNVDENGDDSAFNDIDEQQMAEKKELQNENGQWIRVTLPPRYKLNVRRAKKNGSVLSLSENAATFGCNCGDKKSCSFALRYAF